MGGLFSVFWYFLHGAHWPYVRFLLSFLSSFFSKKKINNFSLSQRAFLIGVYIFYTGEEGQGGPPFVEMNYKRRLAILMSSVIPEPPPPPPVASKGPNPWKDTKTRKTMKVDRSKYHAEEEEEENQYGSSYIWSIRFSFK